MKQVFFLLSMLFAFASNAQTLSGKWKYLYFRDSADVPHTLFVLKLTQQGNSISGQHFCVSYWGDRIDMANGNEITINGKIINDSTANLIVKPRYSFETSSGTAKIEIIGSDSLHFKFIREPTGGEYFIPDDVILIRQAD